MKSSNQSKNNVHLGILPKVLKRRQNEENISKIFPFSKFIEKKYIKSREKETGLKNVFFEKIDLSSNSSREDRLKALVEALKRNGWEVKNEPKDD